MAEVTGGNGTGGALEVRLFGGPLLLRDGVEVPLSPAQRAFLTIVYVEGSITRRELGAILWPGEEGAPVRRRIRQLLHHTKKRADGLLVSSVGDELGTSDDVSSDLDTFHGAVAEGLLLKAARVLAAELAPQALRNVSGGYASWLARERAECRRTLLDAARRKWSRAVEESAWEEARDAAEASYLLTPNDPSAVTNVIEARARVGKVSLAETAYSLHRDWLGPGREVESEIEEVIERARILKHERYGAERYQVAPFVGREDALRAGAEALDRVENAGFAFLLVTGESGIGKTRVLDEISRDAVLRGFRCLHARPVELEQQIFLNPVIDALKQVDIADHLNALGPPWSTVIASVLPSGMYDEWAGELPPIQEGSLPRRLLDAFSMLLERLANEAPTVLFLDDLHWADATTIAALQFFQRRWTTGAFAIVATLRRELVATDAPANVYLEEREGIEVARVDLVDLSDEEALTLIRGIAQGRIDDATMERLSALAGPHPLYLTELTKDHLAGRLVFGDLPDGEVPIPASLKQILQRRFGLLSENAVRIAGVLAVVGREARLLDIAALSGMELDECVECIDELEAGRLVDVRRDAVGISHDLFRSALYSHLSEARRALLHQAVAAHLTKDGDDVAPGELAIHFSRGGDAPAAALHGWSAADEAWEGGAMAEAAYFYELVSECEPDPARAAQALGRFGMSLYLNRDIARAERALGLAADELERHGAVKESLRLYIFQADAFTTTRSHSDEGALQRLLELGRIADRAHDFEAVAMALEMRLRILGRQGDRVGVSKLFQRFTELLSHRLLPPSGRTLCLAGLAMQAKFGDPAAGLVAARKAVSVSRNGAHRLQALSRLLVVLQFQGQSFLPEGQSALAEARRLAERTGDRLHRFHIESNHAVALMDAGELDRAEVGMQKALALGARSDLSKFGLLNNQAELALVRRDFLGARAAFLQARKAIDATAPSYASALVNAGLGLCSLEVGDLAEARRRADDLPSLSVDWTFDPTVLLAFKSRMLERRRRANEAREMLSQQLIVLHPRHVFAWMKAARLLVTLLLRIDGESARALSTQVYTEAVKLNLPLQARWFETALGKAASAG